MNTQSCVENVAGPVFALLAPAVHATPGKLSQVKCVSPGQARWLAMCASLRRPLACAQRLEWLWLVVLIMLSSSSSIVVDRRRRRRRRRCREPTKSKSTGRRL